MNTPVYLDHNATSPLRLEAKNRMIEVMDLGGNPSSVHALGRKAHSTVENARDLIKKVVTAPLNTQVVFTASGTESNTLALNGMVAKRILVSATEHASLVGAAVERECIGVDGNGVLDLDQLQTMLSSSQEKTLVSVMLANNETGTLQNLQEISKLAHSFGALVHSDAVQAFGKIEVDFKTLGVDMMSLSAHKLGGPLGVGALIVAPNVQLTAINRGGGQESGLRGGTENVPAIAGFAVAAERAIAELSMMDGIKDLRNALERQILEIAPLAKIMSDTVDRLPNTSFVTMPGVDSETQVMAFDLGGICVSAGSACGSGKAKSSAVLAAMGIANDIARTAVRISLGPHSTLSDIESFLSVYKDLYERKTHNLNAA